MKAAITLLLLAAPCLNANAAPDGCSPEEQKESTATLLAAIDFCGQTSKEPISRFLEMALAADQKACNVSREQQQPSEAQVSEKLKALNARMPSAFSPKSILEGVFLRDKPEAKKPAFCSSFESSIESLTSEKTPKPERKPEPPRDDRIKSAYREYLGFVPKDRHSNCLFFLVQTVAMQKEFQSAFYGKKSLNEAIFYSEQRIDTKFPPPYQNYFARLEAMRLIQKSIFSGNSTDADLIKYRIASHSQCMAAIQKIRDDMSRERDSIKNHPYNYSQQ